MPVSADVPAGVTDSGTVGAAADGQIAQTTQANCNCLTKQVLAHGSVLFQDICTKQSAFSTPDELRRKRKSRPLRVRIETSWRRFGASWRNRTWMRRMPPTCGRRRARRCCRATSRPDPTCWAGSQACSSRRRPRGWQSRLGRHWPTDQRGNRRAILIAPHGGLFVWGRGGAFDLNLE
jgi:hypothetical protein